MNIEKEVYKIIIANAKSNQKKVESVSMPTLRQLRKGDGKTSVYKVFDALFSNGINKITLNTESGDLTFCAQTRQVFSTPPREYNRKINKN